MYMAVSILFPCLIWNQSVSLYEAPYGAPSGPAVGAPMQLHMELHMQLDIELHTELRMFPYERFKRLKGLAKDFQGTLKKGLKHTEKL